MDKKINIQTKWNLQENLYLTPVNYNRVKENKALL